MKGEILFGGAGTRNLHGDSCLQFGWLAGWVGGWVDAGGQGARAFDWHTANPGSKPVVDEDSKTAATTLSAK